MNSCMYWETCSKLPSNGLTESMATTIANAATIRPSQTPRERVVPIPRTGAMPIVKIVEMLLHIDSRGNTIAAVKAANEMPF